MKISTKGRYGLRALVDLASHAQDGPTPLATIAGRQNISLNYLEQVFGQLRRAGILKSMKGPSGGYLLSRPAEEITVQEILTVLEGSFSITDTDRTVQADILSDTIQKMVWDEIDRRVNRFLKERTLRQLVDEYEKRSGEGLMYFI